MTIFTSQLAWAASFKSEVVELEEKGVYSVYAKYPQIFSTSVVAAYKSINDHIKVIATENCSGTVDDIKQEIEDLYGKDAGISYYSSITARVVGLNQNYVGVEFTSSSFCGGAHPNYATYYFTYDAKTGEVVSFEEEIPVQNISSNEFDKFSAYQKELALLIYNEIQPEIAKNPDAFEGCYSGVTKEEAVETLEMFFPMISGYAANKQVVLTVSPPHAATPCAFSLRVPFSKVEKYFAPNAKARLWLK
jgi:hypothetical protein